MRLINTLTMQLERFHEDELPEYATLSHRWEVEEVDLWQFTSGQASNMYGLEKITNFCRVACARGCKYAWMDTCCIDQKDPTELSEAINSMFRWYSHARTCIVLLSDITSIDDLHKSAWFSRGWTLQELIAPRQVEFFNQRWQFLGLRSNLIERLESITKIQPSVLAGASPRTCSIAQRMSWAAHRRTTRLEDRAYSLLGLFDVSMHATYGIGEEAFIKLQEAIMQRSHDQTIFAWTSEFPKNHLRGLSGLLARSPSAFRGCHNVVCSDPSGLDARFSIGQIGLEIDLYLTPIFMNIYLAVLNCQPTGQPTARYGIFLEWSPASMQYNRVHLNGTSTLKVYWPRRDVPENFYGRQIFVRQQADNLYPDIIYGFKIEHVRLPGYTQGAMDNFRIWPRFGTPCHQYSNYMFIPHGRAGIAGCFSVRNKYSAKSEARIQWMKFGFDNSFNPIVVVGNRSSSGFKLDTAAPQPLNKVKQIQRHLTGDRRVDSTWNVEESDHLKKSLQGGALSLISKSTDPWGHPLACKKATSKKYGIKITFNLEPYDGPRWAPGCSQMTSPRIWTIRVEPHYDDHPKTKFLDRITSDRSKMSFAMGMTLLAFADVMR